ncbi:hypothetical protein [Frigoriflavimonas asaccharolytica]|uniref:Uncharacterized protein n=1 Tax=Frigoriflavimonas asaccharolytica TaxID=2735899 RepID=A0A8J8K8C3_9FLAO|nr:hypothetical protein [Frigoriflavimonas asaccharolytica]NRS91802.1 hypothetical protein [Frigoriflavimonas asaccharolytica]
MGRSDKSVGMPGESVGGEAESVDGEGKRVDFQYLKLFISGESGNSDNYCGINRCLMICRKNIDIFVSTTIKGALIQAILCRFIQVCSE